MAVLDFLFQGAPPPNVNTTTTSQSNMPDWYQEYLRGLVSRSNAIAAEPYQPYTLPRIASFTPNQTTAFSNVAANQGNWQPAVTSAIDTSTGISGGYDATEAAKYLNPYTENVVDRIATLGNRNLTENLLPQMQDQFTFAGQPRGSRWDEFSARALRDTQESILGKQGEALMNAQNASQGQYLQGQGQQLTAASNLGALGQIQQASGIKDAAALQAVGDLQQAQGQRSADLAYSDFLEQRNYPRETAQFLNQIVRGFNPPTGTTTTSSAPASSVGASPLAQLAGVAGSIAALKSAF